MLYRILYNVVNKKIYCLVIFFFTFWYQFICADTCVKLWGIFAFMLNILLSVDLNKPSFSILCRKWWALNKCLLCKLTWICSMHIDILKLLSHMVWVSLSALKFGESYWQMTLWGPAGWEEMQCQPDRK